MNTTETNKTRVTEYLEQVWNAKRLEALSEYVDDNLIQHNPHMPNGRAALEGFLMGFFQNVPNGHFEIKRLIAEGDLVVLHSHFRATAEDHGMAVVDIFRLEDGWLVEHWDVSASIPETTASGNPVV